MIHPALEELYAQRPRKPKELWISGLVFCPRMEYFGYYFMPQVRTINEAALAGIFIHRLIQEKLKEDGYEIEKRIEYDLGDGWKLIGKIDAVNSDHVIEIKTTRDLSKDLQPHWISQANLYAYLVDLDRYILLVVNKLTGEYVEHEFSTDEDKAKEDLLRAEMLKECIIRKRPPEGRKDWCKKFCDYAVFCDVL
jgi:hypothetical protein